MMIDVWAPRNDHPGRKAAPPMAQPKGVAIPNPPGCRGLRNEPKEIVRPELSQRVLDKAWKINAEEQSKFRRMKKALR